MRYLVGLAVSAFAGICLLATIPRAVGDPLTIATLSSRADLVSGGDALIEVRNAAAATVSVTVNGRDVSRLFHTNAERKSLVGLYLKLPLAAPTQSSTSAAP